MYCKYCHSKIENNAVYCRHCGKKQNTKGKKSKRWLVIMIMLLAAAGIFLSGIIILVIMNFFNKNETHSGQAVIKSKDAEELYTAFYNDYIQKYDLHLLMDDMTEGVTNPYEEKYGLINGAGILCAKQCDANQDGVDDLIFIRTSENDRNYSDIVCEIFTVDGNEMKSIGKTVMATDADLCAETHFAVYMIQHNGCNYIYTELDSITSIEVRPFQYRVFSFNEEGLYEVTHIEKTGSTGDFAGLIQDGNALVEEGSPLVPEMFGMYSNKLIAAVEPYGISLDIFDSDSYRFRAAPNYNLQFLASYNIDADQSSKTFDIQWRQMTYGVNDFADTDTELNPDVQYITDYMTWTYDDYQKACHGNYSTISTETGQYFRVFGTDVGIRFENANFSGWDIGDDDKAVSVVYGNFGNPEKVKITDGVHSQMSRSEFESAKDVEMIACNDTSKDPNAYADVDIVKINGASWRFDFEGEDIYSFYLLEDDENIDADTTQSRSDMDNFVEGVFDSVIEKVEDYEMHQNGFDDHSLYFADIYEGMEYSFNAHPQRAGASCRIFVLEYITEAIQNGDMEYSDQLIQLVKTTATGDEPSSYLLVQSITGNFAEGLDLVGNFVQEKGYKDTTVNRFNGDCGNHPQNTPNQTSAQDTGQSMWHIYNAAQRGNKFAKDVLSILATDASPKKGIAAGVWAVCDDVSISNFAGSYLVCENDVALITDGAKVYIISMMFGSLDDAASEHEEALRHMHDISQMILEGLS